MALLNISSFRIASFRVAGRVKARPKLPAMAVSANATGETGGNLPDKAAISVTGRRMPSSRPRRVSRGALAAHHCLSSLVGFCRWVLSPLFFRASNSCCETCRFSEGESKSRMGFYGPAFSERAGVAPLVAVLRIRWWKTRPRGKTRCFQSSTTSLGAL